MPIKPEESPCRPEGRSHLPETTFTILTESRRAFPGQEPHQQVSPLPTYLLCSLSRLATGFS